MAKRQEAIDRILHCNDDCTLCYYNHDINILEEVLNYADKCHKIEERIG